MKDAFASLLCSWLTTALLVALGCQQQQHQQQQQPAPAPMNPKIKAALELGEATTPREVVERFRAAMKYNDVPAALNMVDEINYGTPAATSTRQRFEKIGIDMSRGGEDFKVLESQQEKECAVVLVQQNPGRTGPAELAAIFLIRRYEEFWLISPDLFGYAGIRNLSPAQQASFKALDTWHRKRKADWKMMLSDPK